MVEQGGLLNVALLGNSPCEKFGLKLPSFAVVARAFANPVKRRWRDLGEAPAHGLAGIVLADLDNVVPLRPPDLAGVELSQRIAPEDVPGVERGVINPQCGAVEDARKSPDILDGAAFQHPTEMDFTIALCCVPSSKWTTPSIVQSPISLP